MIKEDYVSFETAKHLKEKGFDEKCHMCWDEVTKTMESADEYATNSELLATYISAPTLQMAMKWLREVHNLHIVLLPFPDGTYDWEAYVISEGKCQCKRRIPAYYGYTYEQACIEGIHYCLENLI